MLHATQRPYWGQSLPFQQFQALLTFFSKCFSSFLHSTCSLSVSCPYLALDGTYHPLRDAFPSIPTLRHRTVTRSRAGRGYHPPWRLVRENLHPRQLQHWAYRLQLPKDFQPELFPLHSPLLRESWLVSFPPPSYMLKSSGSSCLISGPMLKMEWGGVRACALPRLRCSFRGSPRPTLFRPITLSMAGERDRGGLWSC